ncbi:MULTISPECIES: cobalamin biosynthesis protein [Planktothricoides]|uniref:Cobalamin biosynthesis protein n=2 Tax=Planktothricoides raciborskii TaxID=132608 RepID=A0AAU8JF80_9CYAN|nr:MULTISPECIES: cobalamin biosynthesis protein [Planktothricoides]MBD2544135.1 cobalamin biosynthesis protein [Planktothricoides raciborskii FACHB-1370]MBD2582620.1 cobalamin biosynthesis protein [Planktothricoides raciborskii FACHB-1261]
MKFYHNQHQIAPKSEMPQVLLPPRVLWVGVGCQRFTSRKAIETGIEEVFQKNHLAVEAIAGIATIDTKATEAGLVELCRDRQWPLRTFPAEKLRSQAVPNPEAAIAEKILTPSVAEAAALCAVATVSPATDKIAQTGETVRSRSVADAISLLVPKQIFRLETEPGAVTIAVAVAESAYTVISNQNVNNKRES